jgi:hypothetical protein
LAIQGNEFGAAKMKGVLGAWKKRSVLIEE